MPSFLLYAYYTLALVSTPINRYVFGDLGDMVSVSYIPLSLLMLLGITHSITMRIPRELVALLVCFAAVTLIAALHLTQGLNVFLLKYPLFLLFAIVVSRGITEDQVRGLLNITCVCGCVYFVVGSVLRYVNVHGQIVTPANFMRQMFFHKQDYTIVFTLLSGIFVFDMLMNEKDARWRKQRMIASSVILATGIMFFYIKTLLVVGALSVVILYLLGVKSARRYVLTGSLAILALYLGHQYVVESRLLPDHITGYIAWMFDERLLSIERARYVDSLGMRMAIFAENLSAFSNSAISIAIGVGQNTATDIEYFSEISGRTHALPSALESGALTLLVYTGVVGLLGYVFMYVSGFRRWSRVVDRFDREKHSLFGCAVAVNVALFASNIFQDNLSSVTWCWLGVLWYFAHKPWPLGARRQKPAWELQSGHEPWAHWRDARDREPE